MRTTVCNCGSGEYKHALYDARNIFVSYCCSKCEKEVRSRYRLDIFTDGSYECDEAIDDD